MAWVELPELLEADTLLAVGVETTHDAGNASQDLRVVVQRASSHVSHKLPQTIALGHHDRYWFTKACGSGELKTWDRTARQDQSSRRYACNSPQPPGRRLNVLSGLDTNTRRVCTWSCWRCTSQNCVLHFK